MIHTVHAIETTIESRLSIESMLSLGRFLKEFGYNASFVYKISLILDDMSIKSKQQLLDFEDDEAIFQRLQNDPEILPWMARSFIPKLEKKRMEERLKNWSNTARTMNPYHVDT